MFDPDDAMELHCTAKLLFLGGLCMMVVTPPPACMILERIADEN